MVAESICGASKSLLAIISSFEPFKPIAGLMSEICACSDWATNESFCRSVQSDLSEDA
jgi:hypothetical protein